MTTASERPAGSAPVQRFLLVECCHLPQWLYVARQLRQRFPGCRLEALAIDQPQVRYYLKRFPYFEQVHFGHDWAALDGSRFDAVVFPLLNRGYWRIKRQATRLGGTRRSVDFDGTLQPLDTATIRRSMFRPAFPPTEAFAAFLEAFPHRPLGDQVLVVESAHPSLVAETRLRLESLLRSESEVTRITGGSLRENWRALRYRQFSAAVLYLSGEPGYRNLKLLPYLLRIPRILAFNESGDLCNADNAGFLRFLLWRRLHRPRYFPREPRVLLIQTEGWEYLREALLKLRGEALFPGAVVTVICHPDLCAEVAALPGVAQVLPYPEKRDFRALQALCRSIRALRPDLNVAVFSGRPVFRPQKLLFFLAGARRRFVFNAHLDGFWFGWRKLPQMLRREPLLFNQGSGSQRALRVVLFQTESIRYTRAALARLKRRRPFRHPEILLVCRREDAAHFADSVGAAALLEVEDRLTPAGAWKLLRQVRAFRADVKVALFTGRSGHRPAQLLYFLARAQRRFVLNAQLQGYWLTPRTLPWIFRREPLRFDEAGLSQARTRVVLFQTESREYTQAALSRLPQIDLFRDSDIFLVCREQDRPYFQQFLPENFLISYTRPALGNGLWQLLRALHQLKAGFKVAVFTGRPVFRFAKLLYFLARAGRRFALNAQLEGYWLGLRTLRWPLRREPLLFTSDRSTLERAVLIETESTDLMQGAAAILREPHVANGARVVVFCRADRADFYRGLPAVDDVLTYRDRDLAGNLRILWGLLRSRPQVVAALFSGRRIFQKQKLLFWLIRAHGHLAFNEGLDCFYVDRRNCLQLFRPGASGSLLSTLGRQTAKGILFLPRWAYLTLWFHYRRYRRARMLGGRHA